MKNISIRRILFLSVCFVSVLLLGCFLILGKRLGDENIPTFIKNIEVAFDEGKNDFLFKEVTDFKWDELCLFYSVNSEPESGYWAYEEHIKKNAISVTPLDKKNFFMIFIFRNGNDFKQIGVERAYLKINGKKSWIRIMDEKLPTTGGCLKGDIFLKKQDLSMLNLYIKEE